MGVPQLVADAGALKGVPLTLGTNTRKGPRTWDCCLPSSPCSRSGQRRTTWHRRPIRSRTTVLAISATTHAKRGN